MHSVEMLVRLVIICMGFGRDDLDFLLFLVGCMGGSQRIFADTRCLFGPVCGWGWLGGWLGGWNENESAQKRTLFVRCGAFRVEPAAILDTQDIV